MESATAVPSLDNTFGAHLLGSFVSLIFYGVALHQGYRYFRNRRNDASIIGFLVAVVFTLDLAQMILIMHSNYYFLVTHYASPAAITRSVWSLNLIPLVGASVTCTSQSFFLRRLSLISYTYTLVAVFAALFFLGSTVFANRGFTTDSSKFLLNERLLSGFALGAALIANTAVTLSLISVIVRSRSRAREPAHNASKRPQTLADKWTIYVVNTGSLIVLCEIVALVLAVSLPQDLWWGFFYLILVRLHVITFLSVLNARQSVMDDGSGGDSSPYARHTFARATRLATVERWNVPQLPNEAPPAVIDIKITQEVEGETESMAYETRSAPGHGERKGMDSRTSW
ncbi:uncharacterized protein BXZ73DRAFT_101009 [Epithele typhae]|uniref:uncharacterized protein n=1 Tax=Epithele typhae TaxID=378194 RepID=UPI002008351D|nr:uncharacterized protein BXZ73DRAFT_101009 [Epithele typhae]KAH9933624.1 hypothetical protein BXZ73DRAFT_101009 [Epithele typhae]